MKKSLLLLCFRRQPLCTVVQEGKIRKSVGFDVFPCGHISLFKTMLGYSGEYHGISEAAAYGHLDFVILLHNINESYCGCSTSAMDAAAQNGHLDVVKWLHNNRNEGCTTKAMDAAARNGHLDILKWLHQNRQEGCTLCALQSAAVNGRLDIVQWLCENRQEREIYTARAMAFAAHAGQFQVVKWLEELRDYDAEDIAFVISKAAEGGHLCIVEWMHSKYNNIQQECKYAVNYALREGHANVLQFLHENGYKFADFYGNSIDDVLGFCLRSHGHNMAALYCCKHMVNPQETFEWLIRQGYREKAMWLAESIKPNSGSHIIQVN